MIEKDFFKTCFDIVASLNVENESQAIAKEVILDEIESLQQRIDKAIEYIETATICPQSIYHYRNCLYEILKGSDSNER